VLLAETSHELPTPGRKIVSSEPLVGGLDVSRARIRGPML
jgi:hypothetical protein